MGEHFTTLDLRQAFFDTDLSPAFAGESEKRDYTAMRVPNRFSWSNRHLLVSEAPIILLLGVQLSQILGGANWRGKKNKVKTAVAVFRSIAAFYAKRRE